MEPESGKGEAGWGGLTSVAADVDPQRAVARELLSTVKADLLLLARVSLSGWNGCAHCTGNRSNRCPPHTNPAPGVGMTRRILANPTRSNLGQCLRLACLSFSLAPELNKADSVLSYRKLATLLSSLCFCCAGAASNSPHPPQNPHKSSERGCFSSKSFLRYRVPVIWFRFPSHHKTL